MKNFWNNMPEWLKRIIFAAIAAICATITSLLSTSCTVSHVVRQSSTTTTTRNDGTTESVSTTIEYNQTGSGSK